MLLVFLNLIWLCKTSAEEKLREGYMGILCTIFATLL